MNTKATIETQPQVDWNLPEGVETFSEGHVYHAYRIGISEGMEKDQKLFDKLIDDNSALAAKDTITAIKFMEEIGIQPISAHLKIVARYAVKVLITVSNEDFVKESFTSLYDKINQIQENSKTDLYSISFTFVNRSEQFDEELVQLDGFLQSFKKLEKAK